MPMSHNRRRISESFIATRDDGQAATIEQLRQLSLDPPQILVDLDNTRAQELYDQLITAPAAAAAAKSSPAPATGPGSELAAIFASMGIEPTGCAGKCSGRQRQMNIWGIDGCRQNRQVIVSWMREAYGEL